MSDEKLGHDPEVKFHLRRLTPRFDPLSRTRRRLFQLVLAAVNDKFEAGIELLTDGKVYYLGESYDWPEDKETIVQLAQEQRVLINSQIKV